MINYLLSGMDMELGFYEKQKEYIKKDIKDNSIITFIAATFSNIERSKKFANELLNDFKNIGITFKESYVITNEVSKKEAKELIDKSDVVFLLGGDTLEQIKNINEYDIISNLQNRKGITIGISAGSINMANDVALARDIDDNIPDHSFYKGVGLVNINIEPHFDLDNIEHNKDIIEISESNQIICLPDPSFIRVENNNVEIIGNYYMYDKEGNLHKNGGNNESLFSNYFKI